MAGRSWPVRGMQDKLPIHTLACGDTNQLAEQDYSEIFVHASREFNQTHNRLPDRPYRYAHFDHNIIILQHNFKNTQ